MTKKYFVTPDEVILHTSRLKSGQM